MIGPKQASSKTLLCQHMSGNSNEGGSSTIWSGGSSNRPPSTAKNQVDVISVWKRRQPSCSPTRRHHWTKGRKSCKSAATERNTCWSTNNWPFFKNQLQGTPLLVPKKYFKQNLTKNISASKCAVIVIFPQCFWRLETNNISWNQWSSEVQHCLRIFC